MYNYGKTRRLVLFSLIMALWPMMGFVMVEFRAFSGELLVPVFYLLVWFSGFVFPPFFAFLSCFIGHFLFDLMSYFNPLFIFIWTASGLSAFLISLLKNYSRALAFMIIGIPLFYFLAFWMIGIIYFSEQSLGPGKNSLFFFRAYPFFFVILLIWNPIFNFVFYWVFVRPKMTKRFFSYLEQNLQKKSSSSKHMFHRKPFQTN